MRGSVALLLVVGLLGASTAWAADVDLTELKASSPVPYYSAPSWSVVGSVAPTFTDNALFSRDNRKSDFYYEPDVSLRLDGNLTNDLSYRLYARSQYDAFATEKDGNAAVARVGARLTENWDGWRFSAIYENRYDSRRCLPRSRFHIPRRDGLSGARLPRQQFDIVAAVALDLPVFRSCGSSPLALRRGARHRSQARPEMVDREHAIVGKPSGSRTG